jgi:6-phosphogluconolactonase
MKRTLPGIAFLSLLAACAPVRGTRAPGSFAAAEPTGPRTFVYVATGGAGISIFELDATGTLVHRGSSAQVGAVSSLASPPDGRVLVATNKTTGSVVTLAINPKTGALSPLGRAASGGPQPTGAAVDRSGKYALVVNPGSGTVSSLPIKPDGTLAPADVSPAGAGAHTVAVHPGNEVAFVTNQRAGSISQFSFNSGTGTLTPKRGGLVTLPAGSGPTVVVAHPGGHWVYVLNQSNDTISVHAFEEHNRALSVLALQVISTLPKDVPGSKSRGADLCLGREGKFVYAINRGPDSVVTFGVDAATGTLTPLHGDPCGGKGPVGLEVSPSGDFLLVANEGSRDLAVFRLDARTGTPALLTTARVGASPLAVHAVRPEPR